MRGFDRQAPCAVPWCAWALLVRIGTNRAVGFVVYRRQQQTVHVCPGFTVCAFFGSATWYYRRTVGPFGKPELLCKTWLDRRVSRLARALSGGRRG